MGPTRSNRGNYEDESVFGLYVSPENKINSLAINFAVTITRASLLIGQSNRLSCGACTGNKPGKADGK